MNPLTWDWIAGFYQMVPSLSQYRCWKGSYPPKRRDYELDDLRRIPKNNGREGGCTYDSTRGLKGGLSNKPPNR